ncbi:MAG: glycosidase, partial [bacterium]
MNGRTILLVRVEDLRGFSHLTAAWSADGLSDWHIESGPTLAPSKNYPEEEWGLEDPRIVWIEDDRRFAVIYVAYSGSGPLIALAMTEDFREFTRFGPIMPPEDKDAALLPRRIKGRYVLIHRPIRQGEAHIWISFSPDLQYWGGHRMLLPTRPGWWDGGHVGLGAQPIETPEGWLLIYHGVRTTVAGKLYRVGLALLDLEEPWRVRLRSPEWIFGPEAPYEIGGNVPGVV